MSNVSEKSTAAPAASTGPSAALILGDGDDGKTYRVFDGLRRQGGRLFLAGPFFLEVDEEAELEVRLADGPVRTRIRVVEIVRGDQPGMVCTLIGDDAANRRIDAAVAAA